jgi:hypothetical protein
MCRSQFHRAESRARLLCRHLSFVSTEHHQRQQDVSVRVSLWRVSLLLPGRGDLLSAVPRLRCIGPGQPSKLRLHIEPGAAHLPLRLAGSANQPIQRPEVQPLHVCERRPTLFEAVQPGDGVVLRLLQDGIHRALLRGVGMWLSGDTERHDLRLLSAVHPVPTDAATVQRQYMRSGRDSQWCKFRDVPVRLSGLLVAGKRPVHNQNGLMSGHCYLCRFVL